MNEKQVFPAALSGCVQVPGDKSISQRVALLASLAEGTSEVHGYLDGEDARSTLSAMEQLGALVEFRDNRLFIAGVGGRLSQPESSLDLGNSGTGTRLLAGLVAGAGVKVEMRGDSSLSLRPMGRIKEPLELMGATVQLTGERGTLPMSIDGGELKAIRYELPMASAQVKSCVLLAGLYANGVTTVVEPKPTRDHTEKLFELLGLPIHVDGLEVAIEGSGGRVPSIKGRLFNIPGDFSSAAFWLVAVAARPGAELTIDRVGLNPRRTALLDVLKRMGADVEVVVEKACGDEYGSIRVSGTLLRGTVIEGEEIPNLIDELPILAVAGALAEGKTEIRDAEELRVKESDRISEMVKNLRMFGVHVDELPDGMVIYGPAELKTPEKVLDSHGDHRIAMSLAILNTFSTAPVKIGNVGCVDTSYPTFWKHMEHLGGRVL